MATDRDTWAEPVGDPYPLPMDWNGTGWRILSDYDLAEYEQWLAARGHTLEDETP